MVNIYEIKTQTMAASGACQHNLRGFYFLYPRCSFAVRSRDDLNQLSSRTYDSLFVSMHSLSTYSAEDF